VAAKGLYGQREQRLAQVGQVQCRLPAASHTVQGSTSEVLEGSVALAVTVVLDAVRGAASLPPARVARQGSKCVM
jgi:hypothetical protein